MSAQELAVALAGAKGQVAAYQIDSHVSDDAKMIAAAILQAGLQIAATLEQNGGGD